MDIPSPLRFRKPPRHFQTSDDPKHWNLAIKQHAKSNNDLAILSTFSHMECLGVFPDKATLPLVLKACARLCHVERGKSIHRTLKDTCLAGDIRVGTALVDFYGKCGLVEDAREVFDEMPERDVVSWNAMLYGYIGCLCFGEAVSLITRMQNEGGLRPNSRTVVGLISLCREVCDARLGLEIHGYCLRNELFDSDPHVGTALIGFYSRFDAGVSRAVFDLMSVRNIVTWNAIITGLVDVGEFSEACDLFLNLVRGGFEFDPVTLVAVVQACEELGFLNLGIQIHQLNLKSGFGNDLFMVNSLLNMYSRFGFLDLAFRLFENVPNRDLALWNSAIDACIECGVYDEAVNVFSRLREEGIGENERTIAMMLRSCPHFSDGLRKGKSLHARVIKEGMELDVSLGNALLEMYVESNCVEAARMVFDAMASFDVVTWNTLIMALASNKLVSDEAWSLFNEMRGSKFEPNSHTMISILASCHGDTCLGIGRALHSFVLKCGIEIDPSLNTALTEMYMSCGDEATATSMFESFPDRDVVSWNAMIASYVKNNEGEKAQLLFRRMVSEVEPNSVTIINMLSSCTHVAAIFEGQSLHAYITRRSYLHNDMSLKNALVTMYAKCGSMNNAERVFTLLPRRNIISWNALITGYASHGRGDEAILTLSKMIEDGLRPNAATFIAILSACRHCGYVDKGLRFFQSMVRDFKLKPELLHYGCVVDLLCRGSCLDEAREFIESMPFEPDASLWRALLSACRVGSETELATTVFEKLVELEPMNAGNYVLMSNIYASAGLWAEMRKIRAELHEKGLRKSPGMSWIVVRSRVHCFAAGDTSHPQSEMIYENLCSLIALTKESGYIPDISFVSHQEND